MGELRLVAGVVPPSRGRVGNVEARITAPRRVPSTSLGTGVSLDHLQPARASRPPEHPDARTGAVVNDALDLHRIIHVVALAPDEGEDHGDERGWWPVVAFTDDVRPIVLQLNVN